MSQSQSEMGKKWEGGRVDCATVSWSSWALVIHKQENSLNVIDETGQVRKQM